MQDIRTRLRSLPGVKSVTGAFPFPLDGSTNQNARWGTAEALTDPNKYNQGDYHIVLPGYFDTLQTRLIDGRVFTEADNNPDTRNIVIDNRMAAKAFPQQSAIGKQMLVRLRGDDPEWVQVIGVVAHQRHETLAADGRETMFVTDGYTGFGRATRWGVRTEADPARLVPAIRAEIARVDKRLAVAEVLPMQTYVDRAQAQTRFSLVLIAIFAAVAALLAAVGLYGVLSNAVRQRTAEIGLRMALGAGPGSVFSLVVGQGLRLSTAGIAIGLAAAFGLTRVMSSMLVGVEPHDPITFAGIAALFFAISAFACWLPARRAAALDPTVALREE
jgi:predicted permease